MTSAPSNLQGLRDQAMAVRAARLRAVIARHAERLQVRVLPASHVYAAATCHIHTYMHKDCKPVPAHNRC
jgi:hypothetical protein